MTSKGKGAGVLKKHGGQPPPNAPPAQVSGSPDEGGARLAIFFICVLGVVVAAALVVYRCVLKKDFSFNAEFISYALPALAAVIAGLNVYVKREVVWFWISALFVATGLVAFIASKDHAHDVLMEAIVFYGLLSVLAIYPTYRFLRKRRFASKWAKIGVGAIVVVLFALAIFDLVHVNTNQANTSPAMGDKAPKLTCTKSSENKAAHTLVLECTMPD